MTAVALLLKFQINSFNVGVRSRTKIRYENYYVKITKKTLTAW